MQKTRHMIGPVLAVALITGTVMTSLWISNDPVARSTGVRSGLSGVRTEPRYEPIAYRFLYPHERGAITGKLTFARIVEGRIRKDAVWSFDSLDEWYDWAPGFFVREEGWVPHLQPGWFISRWLDETADCTSGELFWRMQALRSLDPESLADEIEWIEINLEALRIQTTQGPPHYDYDSNTLYWNPTGTEDTREDSNLAGESSHTTALITLAYGLGHMCCDLCLSGDDADQDVRERFALATENRIRYILFQKDPTCSQIHPRSRSGETSTDLPSNSAQEAWSIYHSDVTQ